MITNTDYQKFVRVGDQTWEILEISIGIIFLFFLLEICIIYFLNESFQVSPEKKNYSQLKR